MFGPKGKSVTALSKKVGTNRYAGFFQRLGVNWTSRKKAVIFGCYNQGRADFTGNSKVVTQLLALVHVGGVKQNRKVRFAADSVMLIHCLIGLKIKARTDPGRKVSSAEEPMTPIRFGSMFHSMPASGQSGTAR